MFFWNKFFSPANLTYYKDFVMLGAKPQDMTALSIDYVIKI